MKDLDKLFIYQNRQELLFLFVQFKKSLEYIARQKDTIDSHWLIDEARETLNIKTLPP